MKAKETERKLCVMDTYVDLCNHILEFKKIMWTERGRNSWIELNMEYPEPLWNWEKNDYKVVERTRAEMEELRKKKGLECSTP